MIGLFIVCSGSLRGGDRAALIQDTLVQMGAWASVGTVFVGGGLALEQIGEEIFDQVCSKIPFGQRISKTLAPKIISSAVVIPAVLYGYIRNHQVAWYLFYIMYSGKQVSPIIAREVAQDLDSYVRCLGIIRDIHKDLEVLVQKAEQCVAGSGRENILKKLRESMAEMFTQELSRGEAYINSIREGLQSQGYTLISKDVCPDDIGTEGSFNYVCTHFAIRAFEHAGFSKADVDALDSLIHRIIDYWHSYLISLSVAIDRRVTLCWQTHSLENFIAGVLNRPLFPAFEATTNTTSSGPSGGSSSSGGSLVPGGSGGSSGSQNSGGTLIPNGGNKPSFGSAKEGGVNLA